LHEEHTVFRAVEGLDVVVKRTNFGALGLFPQGVGGIICSLASQPGRFVAEMQWSIRSVKNITISLREEESKK